MKKKKFIGRLCKFITVIIKVLKLFCTILPNIEEFALEYAR